MKTIKTVSADGRETVVRGALELEASDLYPSFADEAFSNEDLAAVKPKSFASLQLRVKNAVKRLLSSEHERILVLCADGQADASRSAAALLKELGVGSEVILTLTSPTKAELFSAHALIADHPSVVIMRAAYFLEYERRILKFVRLMEEKPALKLILTGDAVDVAALCMLWQEADAGLHADFVQEFPAVGGLRLTAALCKSICSEQHLKPLSLGAVRLCAMWCARQSSDRRWLNFPYQALISLLCEAHDLSLGEMIEERALLKAIGAADFRVNFLAEAELRDHRDRQLLIATEGAVVGQINGLSVVEMAGSSYEFGEPVRITASLRAGGEGDIIDIERKAELAGQIHAKAMMIINGYVTREFGSETPLPVSASLVFEQSYSEIDGDSASLTGLCAVISCLSEIPLRQDLAVTGAVDQFGDVQPVGGVNEKIEGFFKVCRLHGLSGTQGVIIPKSCLNQLVLRPAIVRAVAAGKFHIYTVSHVEEAFKLLSTVDWGDEKTEGSVVQRIVQRLYEISAGREERPWWKFWG